MSCPDWPALVAARERDSGAEPPGWATARAHLSACSACRRRAVDLDPTLVFLALPALEPREGEISAMQGAVAALVRTRRLESAGERSRPARPARLRRAALAAAALAALVLEAGPRRPAPPPAGLLAAEGLAPGASSAPVVEQIERPDARVYQLPAEGLSVVMIVDASLDV